MGSVRVPRLAILHLARRSKCCFFTWLAVQNAGSSPGSPVQNVVSSPGSYPRCCFFTWLTIQNRLWTSGPPRHQGVAAPPPLCKLCNCQPETPRHILFESRFSRHIWHAATLWISYPALVRNLGSGRPMHGLSILERPCFHPVSLPQRTKIRHHSVGVGDLEGKKCESLQQQVRNTNGPHAEDKIREHKLDPRWR